LLAPALVVAQLAALLLSAIEGTKASGAFDHGNRSSKSDIAKSTSPRRAALKIRALLAKEGVVSRCWRLARWRSGRRLLRPLLCHEAGHASPRPRQDFEEFGARLFVDPKSFLYLNGTTLEYEETLMRQGFVFQNPNAARNCGCGSFYAPSGTDLSLCSLPLFGLVGVGSTQASLTSGWQPLSPATFFVPLGDLLKVIQ